MLCQLITAKLIPEYSSYIIKIAVYNRSEAIYTDKIAVYNRSEATYTDKIAVYNRSEDIYNEICRITDA